MVILFSPSETKSTKSIYEKIDKESLFLPQLYDKRVKAMKIYQDFIDKASLDEKKRLFGVKNEKILQELKNIDIFNDQTQKAVLRYNGVGYEYLNYKSLDKKAQNFIDEHMIIFSNLFGAILAKDKIPFYKLKQGEKIGDFVFENYYKKEFSPALDDYLEDKLIIDLRAAFYDKFYKPKKEYITFKFLKKGKVVSHYAKAYRGLVAREIAKHSPNSEKELMDIEFKGLRICEIKSIKNKKEYIFEIVE